jgi:pectinesterase
MKKLCFLIYASLLISCTAFAKSIHYDAVVSLDGSGNYTSVQEAINAAPDSCVHNYVIFIKAGLYDKEKLIVPRGKTHIMLLGEGEGKTILRYHMRNCDDESTFHRFPTEAYLKYKDDADNIRSSASLTIMGDDFTAENMTIENSAEPVAQAQAVTVRGDRCLFRHCTLRSYQDTVYLFESYIRVCFDDCLIIGRTDYIYGHSIGYFYHCEIRSWGGGWITAPATHKDQRYGFVFNKCRFTYAKNSPRDVSDDSCKIALGRPWHYFPKVAIIYSSYCNEIDPLGWPTTWDMPYAATSTDLQLYEYGNTGRSADMSQRVKWTAIRQLLASEVKDYLPKAVLSGKDSWNPLK